MKPAGLALDVEWLEDSRVKVMTWRGRLLLAPTLSLLFESPLRKDRLLALLRLYLGGDGWAEEFGSSIERSGLSEIVDVGIVRFDDDGRATVADGPWRAVL